MVEKTINAATRRIIVRKSTLASWWLDWKEVDSSAVLMIVLPRAIAEKAMMRVLPSVDGIDTAYVLSARYCPTLVTS